MNYADQGDQASEIERQHLEVAMANRPRPKPFTGKCYNCEATIDKGHYCDSACREDAEKHEHAAKFKRH